MLNGLIEYLEELEADFNFIIDKIITTHEYVVLILAILFLFFIVAFIYLGIIHSQINDLDDKMKIMSKYLQDHQDHIEDK